MARVDTQKLEVPNKVYSRWQEMLQLLSAISEAPVAAIIRLKQNQLEVYCVNFHNDAPFCPGTVFPLGGDHLCHATLSKDSMMMINDITAEPAVEAPTQDAIRESYKEGEFKAYLGTPLHWPNGMPFGILAVFDTKAHQFNRNTQHLLSLCQETIESQLTIEYQNQSLIKDKQELQNRVQTRTIELANLSYQLDKEATKRKQLEREVHYQQHHDMGSGLLNLRTWELESNRMINHTDLYRHEVAVVYLHISNGTRIQTENGIETLDGIIRQLKEKLGNLSNHKQLTARPRTNDIAFTLLFNETEPNYNALIQKLLHVTQQDFDVPSGKVRLQAYIGIAFSDAQRNQLNQGLTNNAYHAMHIARESGKNVVFYDDCTPEVSKRLNHLENYFLDSIREQDLTLRLHPQIDIHHNRCSCSVLSIGWDHPILGNVSGLSMNQLCEQTEIAEAMGRYLINSALECTGRWRQIDEQIRTSISLNTGQLITNELPAFIADRLQQLQLPADGLEIEIPEKQLYANKAYILPVLEEINRLGVILTLSEFGHGQISFSSLKSSPFKRIKIDTSFTENLQQSAEDRSFLNSLMQITDKLELDVVITGIETQAQEQWLMQFNRAFAEGDFYLQGQSSPTDFEQLLRNQTKNHSH